MPSLPSELTVYTAGEMRAECLRWVAELSERDSPDDAYEVVASNVDDIDAAGVQILLSLSNSLAQAGRRLRLVEPSAALIAACVALGSTGLHDGHQTEEIT